MAMSSWLRWPTSLTLALAFGLLALLGQWMSHRVSDGLLVDALRQREIDKVTTVGQIVRDLIDQHGAQARLVARMLAEHSDLAVAMQAREPQRSHGVAAVLDRAYETTRLALLEVTDAHAVVVHRAHDRGRSGDRSVAWGVDEALRGQGMLASARARAAVEVRATEPLRGGTRVLGSVTAGTTIDHDFLARLNRTVDATLAVLARDGATVIAPAEQAGQVEREAVQEAFAAKVPVYRVDAVTRRTSVYLPVMLVDDGYVLFAQIDSRETWQVLDEARRSSAVYGALTLVLVAALGLAALWVALRPLRRLREHAQAIAVELTGAPIAGVGRDEVRSVVEALRTLTDRLVQRNRELGDAIVAAQAASSAKSQFLSTMSHEIRTPLNGVLGMTDLLRRTGLDADQRRYVEAIVTAGRSLHELLSDLLDLSRIEAGQLPLERVAVDLRALLAEVAAVHREVALARGLELRCEVDTLPAEPVHADPTRLRQVVGNLLGNAVKFTHRGRIVLRAEVSDPPAGDARRWIRVTVEDTGIGIDEQAQQRLFERFVQADSTMSRRFGGSGLGLAISRHLVERMGGTIHVFSVPGRGSRFWFVVPLEPAAESAAAESPAAPPAQSPAVTAGLPSAPGTRAARVLLVEDNAINRTVIEEMLRGTPTEVSWAEHGAAALERLQQEAFDLVLMDCQMPVMDGLEATRRLRAWERDRPDRPALPVVALTANALPSDREACLAAGMNEYLAKPIVRTELLATLARLLGREPSAAATDDRPRAPAAAPDGPCALDPAVLGALPMVADGSRPQFALELLEMFSAHLPAVLGSVAEAHRRADLAAMRRTLHSLKSSAGQVGALAIAEVAREMEERLRAGEASGTDWPDRLRDEARRFGAALDEHRRACARAAGSTG